MAINKLLKEKTIHLRKSADKDDTTKIELSGTLFRTDDVKTLQLEIRQGIIMFENDKIATVLKCTEGSLVVFRKADIYGTTNIGGSYHIRLYGGEYVAGKGPEWLEEDTLFDMEALNATAN